MLLYIFYFGRLMGFIIHFYIIFGTNLLTGGPAQIADFLPISVFCRKRISNGVPTDIYSDIIVGQMSGVFGLRKQTPGDTSPMYL